MIGALTKQLVWWARSIPTAVSNLFEWRELEQRSVDEDDAKTIFNHVLGKFDAVYICIDALDECVREALTQLLQFLKAVESTSIRLFLTGRHSVEAEVTGALSDLSPKTIAIAAVEEDIRIYLSQKLASDPYPEAMNEDFRNQIVEKLVEVSQGL
jgi:anion-transporting  ArsA/GET3 family ATPase